MGSHGMDVGFLGLGIMGIAMARNLLKKGFKVTVWNRSLAKVRGFFSTAIVVLFWLNWRLDDGFYCVERGVQGKSSN